jgi:ribonuclease P protein component
MLKKQYRGLTRKEVAYAQKKGKTIGNRFFAAWVLKKKERPVQFALIISKKVSKKAVERNLIRRRIYEIIRTHYTDWETPQIIIISAKQVCVDASFEEIKENLLHLLKLTATKE